MGQLTRPPGRSSERDEVRPLHMSACTNCGSTDRCVVSFDVAGGAVYTFCRYCEKSSWQADGEAVQTHEMLVHASKIEPARARR